MRRSTGEMYDDWLVRYSPRSLQSCRLLCDEQVQLVAQESFAFELGVA